MVNVMVTVYIYFSITIGSIGLVTAVYFVKIPLHLLQVNARKMNSSTLINQIARIHARTMTILLFCVALGIQVAFAKMV